MARILVFCIALFLSSCSPRGRGTFFTSGIRDYTGDGTIQDTSQGGGFFSTRCYMVRLPPFPLNRPFEHTFSLDGLPTIEGKPTEIAFFVPNSFSQTHAPNGRSIIEFSLSTADGKQVTSLNSTLGALTWSGPAHPIHYDGQALYEIDKSFFQAVAGERYRLHIIYSPAPAQAATRVIFTFGAEWADHEPNGRSGVATIAGPNDYFFMVGLQNYAVPEDRASPALTSLVKELRDFAN